MFYIFFIVSFYFYLFGCDLLLWEYLVFVYFAMRIFTLISSFKKRTPLFDVFTLIYFVDNALSLSLIHFFYGDIFSIGDTLYSKVPLIEYLPFAFLSMQSVYLAYKFVKKSDSIWNDYLLNHRNLNLNILLKFYSFGIIVVFLNVLGLDFGFFSYAFFICTYSISIFLYLNNKKKYWIHLLLAGFILLYKTLTTGMFGDFVIILLFFSVFTLRKLILTTRVNYFVLKFVVVFVVASFSLAQLQIFKQNIRNETWNDGGTSYSMDFGANDYSEERMLFLPILLRLNQSYIVSATMLRVPADVEFQFGLTILNSLRDAFLPRFLIPDKEKAGGREKIAKYTTLVLVGNTSMNVGFLGEAYLNFGRTLSILFFALFGFCIGKIEQFILILSIKNRLLLVFTPFLFYGFAGSGIDFMLLLNNLVKSAILVFFVISVIDFFGKNIIDTNGNFDSSQEQL